MAKFKNKGRILKAAQEKQEETYKIHVIGVPEGEEEEQGIKPV